MPVYRLPSADLVRDALLSGAVPPAVARLPVAASATGKLLIELPADRREFFTRRGATPEPNPGRLTLVPCWGVLVPLVRDGSQPEARAREDITPPSLALRAAIRRPNRVFLGEDGRAWSEGSAGDYRSAGPGVWVRAGWRHPAAAHLAPPVGSQLVLDPPAAWALIADQPLNPLRVLPLPARPVPPAAAVRPRLAVRPTRGGHAPAALWVRPDAAAEVVAELGLEATERFEMAGTLVRGEGQPAEWAGGWCAVEGVHGLYVPHGRTLTPEVGRLVVDKVAAVAPAPAPLVLLADDTLTIATARFRPLADRVRVVAPPAARLLVRLVASPFEPPPVQPEAVAPPDEIAGPVPLPRRRPTMRPPSPSQASPSRHLAAPIPSRPEAVVGRLVRDSATLDPTERAALWAELAAGDNAGWLNAVWCHPDPPPAWREAIPPSDDREQDRSVRAVWLDCVSRLADDPLAVARCRDRLLARLDRGPRLDLDVPAFLRRSNRGPDPFAARDWLADIAPLLRKWLTGCGDGTRLVRAGLDADRASTRRYAELLLAGGLAAAGDATAVERAEASAAALAGLKRGDDEQSVHRLLGAEFAARVRAALDAEPTPRPSADLSPLSELGRYAAGRLLAACDGDSPPGLAAARAGHRPDAFRALLNPLDPAAVLNFAGPLFRAADPLGLVGEVAARLTGAQPTVGGRRDLGLAIGRFLLGDVAGGEQALDAARYRLFVTGEPDLRRRGGLAAAYAAAAGYGPPGMVLGRLDELVRRLGPVSAAGAGGRYFALLPLRVVDAVVRAAVGGDFRPSPAVRQFLADEERLTRRRIHRDMRTLLGSA